jgi:hypothetical protein
METKDWINIALLAITVVATIIGPISAVWVSRLGEEGREKTRRQYHILHSLMRTRAFVLHVDHVAALNLVQLEFYGHANIDQAFRRYMEHLNTLAPKEAGALKQFGEERDDRFYSLIQQIADLLGYKFDKADLRRLSYMPQGWNDQEALQRGISARIIELLDFKRPLPVRQFHQSDVSDKFPPPPTVA